MRARCESVHRVSSGTRDVRLFCNIIFFTDYVARRARVYGVFSSRSSRRPQSATTMRARAS